jgi:hypothetical protein
MILSHEHKFVFICNGKTGTSSIEAALREYQDGAEFEVGVSGLYHGKHIPPSVLRSMLGKQVWEEYFTFCFVRNPWDWFVSQYFWNWAPDPISKKAALHSPFRTLQRYRERWRRKQYLRELDQFSTKEIRQTYDLLKRYRGVYQADSLFQYHYAYAPDGAKLVDFVGRFEQIEVDFARAMEHVGLDVRLPHRNPTDHKSYQAYYTAETAALIDDLYEIDVQTFGYENPFPDGE